MHNDSVYRYDPNRDSASTQRSSNKPPSSTDGTREREDVPRFRKLMERKSGKAVDDHEQGNAASASGRKEAAGGKQSGADGKPQTADAKQQTERGKGSSPTGEKEQAGGDAGLLAVLGRSQGGRGGEGDAGDDGEGGGGSHTHTSHGADSLVMDAPLGMQLQQQNQVVLQQSIQPPPTASAAIAPALAELIERHVKNLLVPVSETQSAAQSREIMLTLKGGVLPGTELWLSRTDTGWRLRADAHSAASYRQMVDNAPQLIERFGKARLGELEVDPTLVG